VHLVDDNLAVGVEAGGKWSGHCSYRVVDLVLSTCVSGLVSKYSNEFKISMATTSALRHRFLGKHAQILNGYHQQRQASFSRAMMAKFVSRVTFADWSWVSWVQKRHELFYSQLGLEDAMCTRLAQRKCTRASKWIHVLNHPNNHNKPFECNQFSGTRSSCSLTPHFYMHWYIIALWWRGKQRCWRRTATHH
jgi:hypothetical protein